MILQGYKSNHNPATSTFIDMEAVSCKIPIIISRSFISGTAMAGHTVIH